MNFLRRFAPLVLLLVAFVARAQEIRRPNILFVIADDWSNGHSSIQGTPWIKTPAFDRVAREGILFTNCFTSNPKCSPSRATMLTGRNTWQLEEACNHFSIFPAKFPVYTRLLENAGYHVGHTGKGWGPGEFRSQGFEHNPAGRAYNDHKLSPPYAGISSVDYARNFEAFLAARPAGAPFCFWLGTNEPHASYEQYSGRREGKDIQQVKVPGYHPDTASVRQNYLDYAVEVEWLDRHLGRALAALERSGELEHTLVVVTSDHGMPLPRVKGQIYEHGFHLPLAIRWGAVVKPGRVVEDFVNVRDFAPTFLEAAGVNVPAEMTGASLLTLLRSPASGWIEPARRNRMLVGKERHDLGRPNDWGYPVRALRTPEWLYIRNYEPDRWPSGNPETGYRNCDHGPTKDVITNSFDRYYQLSFGRRPPEELYRVDRDPDCVDNLAGQAGHALIQAQLRAEMKQMLEAEGDPRMFGRGGMFEKFEYVGSRKHAWDTWLKHQ